MQAQRPLAVVSSSLKLQMSLLGTRNLNISGRSMAEVYKRCFGG